MTAHPEAGGVIAGHAVFWSGRTEPPYDVSDQDFQVYDPWNDYPALCAEHTTSAMMFRPGNFCRMARV